MNTSSFSINTLDDFFTWASQCTNLEKRAPSTQLHQEYHTTRMQKLVQLHHNPQLTYKIIHVAGSKGKSTTSNMIAQILASAGYRVGCYLSPHVSDWRERVQVMPVQPTDEELLPVATTIYQQCTHPSDAAHSATKDTPTTFELLTLWALMVFRKLRCDWVVLECGLGGRLDSTNIVDPYLSVIGTIEKEHTEYLGNTLDKIAREKAGIIKKQRRVVVLAQHSRVLREIKQVAHRQRAPLSIVTGRSTDSYQNTDTGSTHSRPYARTLNVQIDTPPTDVGEAKTEKVTVQYRKNILTNNSEALNASLAVAAAREITPKINLAIIQHGLSQAQLPGRYEQVSTNPTIICDGAHTPRSIQYTVASFQKHFGTNGAILFGCKNNKSIQKIASVIASFTAIYLTDIPSVQSADPTQVYTLLKKLGTRATICNWKTMLTHYLAHTKDPLLICGSFYLVGAVKGMLNPKKNTINNINVATQ